MTERRQGLEELRRDVHVLTTEMKGMKETLDNVHRHVVGNGRPGLTERVALLEASNGRREYWTTLILRPLIPVGLTLLGIGSVVTAVMYARAHL